MNYSGSISISRISESIGINRKYFSKIFKEAVGSAPIEYLINYRLTKACELMQNKTLTVGEIARSVGYDDQLLFSRIFKKYKGCSPNYYLKNS
jgi:AraC-like DNA-binding protein